jgi:hypothetical protein
MPKRSSKRDFAQNARRVVEEAIGEPLTPQPEKNQAAVALGRLGGLKGGRARAAKLSARKLSSIGKIGAAARWKQRKP